MHTNEVTALVERLARLEAALESVPRGEPGGTGWREPAAAAGGSGLAVGDIKLAGRTADHTADGHQWLLCNGRALSRTTYAALFAAIGESYGPGDGSGTFDIPKFTSCGGYYEVGRVPIGAGGPFSPGQTGGSQFHSHTGSSQNAQAGVSIQPAGPAYFTKNDNLYGDNEHYIKTLDDTDPVGEHTHAVTDGGHSHPVTVNQTETLPPYLAAGFFILAGK